jgi:hypothetical protein
MVDEAKTSAELSEAEKTDKKHGILIDQAKHRIREALASLEAAEAKLTQVDTQGAKVRRAELQVGRDSIGSTLSKLEATNPTKPAIGGK